MKRVKLITREDTNLDILKAKNGYLRDKHLAEDLGWTPAQLHQRVSGAISMDTIITLANFFKVTPKEMLK